MRFIDYIKLSSDGDNAMFRTMSLRLIKESTEGDNIIKRLSDRYQYVQEAFYIKKHLNKKLSTMYTGSYKYDFCVNEGISVNDLKINKRYKEKLRIDNHISNNNLILLKKKFEIDLNKLTLT